MTNFSAEKIFRLEDIINISENLPGFGNYTLGLHRMI